MIERPLLLRGPQVRAFREGRQTQDRRPMKPQPFYDQEAWKNNFNFSRDHNGTWIWQPRKDTRWFYWDNWGGFDPRISLDCPFGREGDQLWVRESWATPGNYDHVKPSDLPNHIGCEIVYRATEQYPLYYHWRPSIHMPRWASRLILEIEQVRAERVQSISENDAIAEGVEKNWTGQDCPPEYENEWRDYLADDDGLPCFSAKQSFATLWDSIYAKIYPWVSNPWVWVMDLKVVDENRES